MPKYAVTVEVTVTYLVTVESESLEDAESKALDMDYSEMKELDETVEAFAELHN